jgi:membrane protein
MFKKLKARFKKTKLYALYRVVRFLFNQHPRYVKVKKFILYYFKGLLNRIDEHHIFLLAGGLSFSIFVCAIPFTLIIFAILGSIFDSSYMQYQLDILINTVIPYHQYSEFVKNIIYSRIDEVIEYRNLAGFIGGLGLLFASSGLFSSMRTILNRVMGIEVTEHFILSKLKDFALVILFILAFFVTTILIPLIELLRRGANNFSALSFLQAGIFAHFMFSVLSFLLVFILFLMMYFFVPKRKLSKRAIFLSSFCAAVLWEAAKELFGFYIYHFGSLGKIYGTYALIVVVAFWIYYSSVVFIIGAEIGRLFYERRYQRNRESEML